SCGPAEVKPRSGTSFRWEDFLPARSGFAIYLVQTPLRGRERKAATRDGRPLSVRAGRRPGTLPAQHRGPPRQPSSESAQHYQLAWLDPPFGHRFIESQGHGTGRGVAIAFEVVEDPGTWDVQHINRRIDDADVGLVRDVHIDVAWTETAVAQHILDG